jgi:cyclic dehypoxanthinyl futalosine synthase
MDTDRIFEKVYEGEELSYGEAVHLYLTAALTDLMAAAYSLRLKKYPENIVTWMVDRNVNITNICFAKCRFCNFCVNKSDKNAYITTRSEYRHKIDELYRLGGRQLLLQGGMHPDLGIEFYEDLFTALKSEYPDLRLHALGPPEIVYLAKKSGISFRDVLLRLVKSGLDSLPGAGAEILVDRVRQIISPAKASSDEWLMVMQEAHGLGLVTSATMMFGHIETPEERIKHLFKIKELQDRKPEGSLGFISFIPWTFQSKGTKLYDSTGVGEHITPEDYIRLIAISRIILSNIAHIQPSWLTIGKEVAQICLWAGADDFGSVMMEENVVSSAGTRLNMNVAEIQNTIIEAGFTPCQRTPLFEMA